MSWPLSLTCTFFEPRRGRDQKWLQPPTGPSPGTSPSDPTVSPIGFHPAVVEEAWIWAEAAATTPRRRDTPVQAGPYPASRRRLRWDLSRLRDAPSSRFRSTRIPHPHSLPTPPSPSLPWGAQYLLVVFLLLIFPGLAGQLLFPTVRFGRAGEESWAQRPGRVCPDAGPGSPCTSRSWAQPRGACLQIQGLGLQSEAAPGSMMAGGPGLI